MIVWLLAIGLISMLGQVVLLRELNVAYYGSELIYILALGFWLLWSAAGAALGRRSRLPSPLHVRYLLLSLTLALPLAVVATRGLRRLFGAVPGAYLPFGRQMLALALVLLPVGLLLGLLFQWAAKLHVGERRTLASAYAIESAGGVVGGILATGFMAWGLQNLVAALLCALAALAAACWPWRREQPRWLPVTIVALFVLLLAGLIFHGQLDRGLTAWNHPLLAATRDSPYGRITVTANEGQVSVFENDALAFETEGTAAEEFVQLAAIQRPAPRSVLVLGGGLEGLVAELLGHGPQRVDYVELNPVLIEVLRPYLPDDTRQSLRAPQVQLFDADPRRFVERPGRYDLILVGMPEPDSGQANRYYTREFFAHCAARLGADGVLALRLRGAENLWTPLMAQRTASIARALRESFANVVALPGTTTILLGSRSALPRDPVVLGQRLQDRGIAARLVVPAYVEYLYRNDRFAELAGLLQHTAAPVNSDLRPICYPYTLLIGLSRFFPAAARIEFPEAGAAAWLHRPATWIVFVLTVSVLLLGRRTERRRRALLAAVAGFAGIVLETVLILHYQTIRGVLFQDLGLLLTLFMGGLALGSATLHAWQGRRPIGTRSAGALLLLLLAALGALTAGLLGAGLARTLPVLALLLLATGYLVAAIFAYASLYGRPEQRSVVSVLYSADLLGGCAGSLAASLLLIPFLGLPASALLVALLALLALTLL